jgi:nitroreductase
MAHDVEGHARTGAMLLDSPHVGLDLHPDVRAGVLTRRTFRTFEHRPVAAAVRASVLEAARWALVAEDADMLRLVAIDDAELKRVLFRLTRESKDISNHWEGLFKPSGLRGYVQYWPNTPFCVAVCADPGAGPRHIHNGWNHHIASAAAAENLALAARWHGMALVMYTHFSQEKLKRLLDIPFHWDVLGVMGLGYPDLRRTNPQVLEASLVRLPLTELVSAERYGQPAPLDVRADAAPTRRFPDLMDVMLNLRMPARFTTEPVAAADLFAILQAGQWSPSAGNFQPVRYVVLRDRERLGRLEALARESREISGHWFSRYREGFSEHPDWTQVPVAIALIADPSRGGPHIHGEATHVHAGGLAAQNMSLMTHALGLGTGLVTHWIEEKVKVLIDCPRTWDLVGVMPIGTAAESPPRHRPPLSALVWQDTFGRAWDPGREFPFRASVSPTPEI